MATFFQVCISFDGEIEITELILRRYSNIDYIFSLDVLSFMQFIILAKQKETEEKQYLTWAIQIPHMNEFVSFPQYQKMLKGEHIDNRTTRQILQEVAEIETELGV